MSSPSAMNADLHAGSGDAERPGGLCRWVAASRRGSSQGPVGRVAPGQAGRTHRAAGPHRTTGAAGPAPPAHWGLELLLRPNGLPKAITWSGTTAATSGLACSRARSPGETVAAYHVDQRVTPHVPGVGSLQLRKQRSLGLFLGRFEDARGHSCPRLCRRLVCLITTMRHALVTFVERASRLSLRSAAPPSKPAAPLMPRAEGSALSMRNLRLQTLPKTQQ